MKPPELMQALLDLAEEVGLEVRVVGAHGIEGDPVPASGLCRVKGRVWVVLSGIDSVDTQKSVLAGALNAHSGEVLEDRWLPPAVRDALDAARA